MRKRFPGKALTPKSTGNNGKVQGERTVKTPATNVINHKAISKEQLKTAKYRRK